ncbi:hypothetical protein GB937_001868 [Aspergillus fischeri]|nr:hypothetical protein GB937_001868 [Aspergillus fischeri]
MQYHRLVTIPGKAIPDFSLNASRSAAVQSVTSIFPGSCANTSPSILSPAISTANCGVTPHAYRQSAGPAPRTATDEVQLTQKTGTSPSSNTCASPQSGVLISLIPNLSAPSHPHATGSPCVAPYGLVTSLTRSTSSSKYGLIETTMHASLNTPAGMSGTVVRYMATTRPEAYVVGCVHILEILFGCDVAAGLVDAVLREVGAEVKVWTGDAGCWGDGVRIALGDDAEERAGDGVAEAEGVEVWGVAGGEDQEVGLEGAGGEARGVCYEVLAGEEAGGVSIASVVAFACGDAGGGGGGGGHAAAAAGHAVHFAS